MIAYSAFSIHHLAFFVYGDETGLLRGVGSFQKRKARRNEAGVQEARAGMAS